MPRGEFRKIKGTICNVPLNSPDVVTKLPRGNDSNSIVIIKLKRKLEYKNNIYYESVRPEVLLEFLSFLKEANPLYSDIQLVHDNIPAEFSNLGASVDDCDSEDEICFHIESEEKKSIDPLIEHRLANSETALINQSNEIAISPCEGITPLPLWNDENVEELAHPFLFPTGKFGFKFDRDVTLSPVRYFNQRLLNYTQRFSSDSDYLFFAQAVTQQLRINSQISIAMRKIPGVLTAGALTADYDNTVNTFLHNEKAFKFLSEIKGSPSY